MSRNDSKHLPVLVGTPEEPCLYDENPIKCELWCREAWWTGRHSNKEIRDITDVKQWRLDQWIWGTRSRPGWKKERERAYANNAKKAAKQNLEMINDSLVGLLTLVDEAVERWKDENTHLTIDQLKSIFPTVKELFNMRQLLLGDPTEIMRHELTGSLDKGSPWQHLLEDLKEVDILDYSSLEKVKVDGRPKEEAS